MPTAHPANEPITIHHTHAVLKLLRGPGLTTRVRSHCQSCLDLVKVFMLEPVRRHQSRTIPPQLSRLHTGLPDIPCRFKPSRLTSSTLFGQPKPPGPNPKLLRIRTVQYGLCCQQVKSQLSATIATQNTYLDVFYQEQRRPKPAESDQVILSSPLLS